MSREATLHAAVQRREADLVVDCVMGQYECFGNYGGNLRDLRRYTPS